MRVCFVCNEYPPARHGGIGVFTQVLARALVAAGHEVRVVGACAPAAKEPAYEEDAGVRVWRIPADSKRLHWMRARYRVFRRVAEWVRLGEIDIIEAPDYEGWVAAWPKLPVPIVVRLHGSVSYFAAEMGRLSIGSAFWIEYAALGRADFLCATSRYTARRTTELFNLGERRMATLYNGIELPPLSTRTRRPNQVVFSGTLAPKKGVYSLIQAWPHVCNRVRRAELHLYGKDGRDAEGNSIMENLRVRLNGLGSSVHFHGHVSREVLFDALDSSTVAVFPSFAEAFALAPLESMARGCATVYSRRGSGPELIRDGEDGLLVDPENPREIAGAIAALLADPALAARLGASGRERVRANFSSQVLTKRNVDYYTSCMQEFRGWA